PSHRDLLWLGRVLGAAGRAEEAEGALLAATRKAPDVAETWLGLIAHYHRTKQKGEAVAALGRMKRNVSEELLPLALGKACEILGRFDDAEKAYREFLAERPRDAEGLRW